jgi:elongation factor 1-gamma
MKSYSILLNALKKSLTPFEKHLKLRNFLVGYSLTLADVTLVVNLLTPLQTVLDAQFRKDNLPNLSRFCSLILESRAFVGTFGRVHFAKKALQVNLAKPAEQPKQAPAPKAQPAKPQAAPKKETAPVEAPVKAPKEQTWEDKLPPIKEGFDLQEFKTLVVNAADKHEAFQQLWSNWDDSAMSFYFVHYDKYDGEGVVLHQTTNLMNGFLQRMDEKLRRHALCVLGVYGDEPNLEIMGAFFWRGVGEIEPMKEHPQFEYYKKRLLDIKCSQADRELVERFWTIKAGEVFPSPYGEGKTLTVQERKFFK